MKQRYLIAGTLALAVLALDQITKLWIQNRIELWTEWTIIPGFFNLVHVLNKGAAFGFLNRADIQWQTSFFIAVSVLAVLLIGHLLRTVDREDPLLFTGLGLILGGALGNLADRVRLGEVVDFLDFYLGRHHWPAFNVADMAISLGGLCLLVSLYRKHKRLHESGAD